MKWYRLIYQFLVWANILIPGSSANSVTPQPFRDTGSFRVRHLQITPDLLCPTEECGSTSKNISSTRYSHHWPTIGVGIWIQRSLGVRSTPPSATSNQPFLPTFQWAPTCPHLTTKLGPSWVLGQPFLVIYSCKRLGTRGKHLLLGQRMLKAQRAILTFLSFLG